MARLARTTINGYPHQVTQRGNYGQPVFEEDADFRQYLAWACEYFNRYSIEIWAFCLMPNHVHFVCVPKSVGALASSFNTLHMRYAQYYHKKNGLSGHLWKGRFLSCLLDAPSVLEEIRFIENNPVRSGFVTRAEDYPWSSARGHMNHTADPLLTACPLATSVGEGWQRFLMADGNPEILRRIRLCLKTGRPAGDDDFVRAAERILGRRLRALPRGRPKKHPLVSQPVG